MANIKMEGLEDYIKDLEKLANPTGMIKMAVYDGAGVVADAVRAAIETIPEHSGRYIPNEAPLWGITKEQKQGLREGLYVGQMQNDKGFIYTFIDFGGYNSVTTKKYPHGQPNMLIARSVESGTSRRSKVRFVAKSANKARPAAEQAMADRVDKYLKTIMEG